MRFQPEAAATAHLIDLAAIGHTLHAEIEATHAEHLARTILREPDLRVVVVAMAAGAALAEHHVDATATVQVLSGHVSVALLDRVMELGVGRLMPIARGCAHDVVAVEASTFVLTLAGRTA